MDCAVRYLPLAEQDLAELAAVLLNESVYQHIGGMPSQDDFKLDLKNAIKGPQAARSAERWLNFVARHSGSGQIIGRLEATVHDGISEVAFLYGPQYWGNGYATDGLRWLHQQLKQFEGVSGFWATTVPANARSSALLERCGYLQVQYTGLPPLYSYDPGDSVFAHKDVV